MRVPSSAETTLASGNSQTPVNHFPLNTLSEGLHKVHMEKRSDSVLIIRLGGGLLNDIHLVPWKLLTDNHQVAAFGRSASGDVCAVDLY